MPLPCKIPKLRPPCNPRSRKVQDVGHLEVQEFAIAWTSRQTESIFFHVAETLQDHASHELSG